MGNELFLILDDNVSNKIFIKLVYLLCFYFLWFKERIFFKNKNNLNNKKGEKFSICLFCFVIIEEIVFVNNEDNKFKVKLIISGCLLFFDRFIFLF